MRHLPDILARQRGHLFEWVPVLVAIGIGLYFAWRGEPSDRSLAAVFSMGAAAVLVAYWRAGNLAPMILALALVAFGFVLAGTRAHLMSGPVLEHRYYGAVTGRVVALDRSASDRLRITLDRVWLERKAPQVTPARVRISLHAASVGMNEFVPGQVVMTTAHLAPPQGPVEPGGFDFQRHAWFMRLGAVGYSRVPVVLWQAPAPGPALAVGRARMAMSGWVQSQIPGPTGRFAAALMTGDRSGMDMQVLSDLRRSNLAHLLAISGLHMGLLTGFVFAALRLALAAVPVVSLRVPAKKLAALAALCAGAGYLVLSGATVATERAFVMVAVVLSAVLVDRRAISLRSVALAALIVLIMRPETLLSPGFQMSFAATTALVAAFSALRGSGRRTPADPAGAAGRPGGQGGWRQRGRGLPASWLLRWVGALVVSSAVAGGATSPFAAAHFNVFANYGLLANLASVPLMGTVVMPGAVLAVLLAPLGFEAVGFALVEAGLDWILHVAGQVAAMEGAVRHIPQPNGATLPLLSLGALFVVLWQGRMRVVGAAPVVAALVLWAGSDRPDLLVAEEGALVGILAQDGRRLSRARGAGFAARVWLENDGDGAPQAQAFARSGLTASDRATLQRLSDTRILHLSGKLARQAGPDECAGADIVIAAARIEGARHWPCLVLDQAYLRQSGALAGYLSRGKLRLVSVAQHRGRRMWSPRGSDPGQ